MLLSRTRTCIGLCSGALQTHLGLTWTRSTRTPRHPVECRCSDRPCPSWPRTADGDDPIWQQATSTWVLVGQIASLFSTLLPGNLAVQLKRTYPPGRDTVKN